MNPPDKCLSHLETLALGTDGNAIVLAESYIEELLQNSEDDRISSARLLGDIQDQFLRRTAPSPIRADIFDLLGNHILRLLEPESGVPD